MWFLLTTLAFAGGCPKGKLKECQTYLQKVHEHLSARRFANKFDEVCGQNKNFTCIKTIVRGDVPQEMKDQAKDRGPAASLFPVRLDDENYIFVLAPK